MSIQTPKPLNQQQINFFVENGYLIVENLINAEEIKEMHVDTVKIARGDYACDSIKPADKSLNETVPFF